MSELTPKTPDEELLSKELAESQVKDILSIKTSLDRLSNKPKFTDMVIEFASIGSALYFLLKKSTSSDYSNKDMVNILSVKEHIFKVLREDNKKD